MWFIRLPKAIDIAKRVVPSLVGDWMNPNSLQILDIRLVQRLEVNMLISWVIKWSKSGRLHRRIFRNFTQQAEATWDWSYHNLFWIIPDTGHWKRIPLSVEFISTIPFQAMTSYVKFPEWGQHSSNYRMPYLVSIFRTIWGIWNQPNNNQGMFGRCPADIFSYLSNWEVQWPDMLIAWKICHVRFVGWTNDWDNHCPGSNLITHIQPPMAQVQVAVYWTTFPFFMAHRFKIELRLKWVMSPMELYTFENIPVL